MLKWCPEPFTSDRGPERTAAGGRPEFVSGLALDGMGRAQGQEDRPVFESDPRLARATSLWNQLDETDKDSLMDSARSFLQEEFEARENQLRENQKRELAQVRGELEVRLENWSREFSSGLARERHEMAVEAAGLAVALARKIIRDTVDADPDFVVRTLETALFKAQDSHPLTAVLHPDDAEYLAQKPELLSRLRIEKIVPDRRMEKGGCRVRAGVQEWDASLTRQVDTLAAIVEETLAAGEVALVPGPGDNDDPGLE